jgi:hypothetical protein
MTPILSRIVAGTLLTLSLTFVGSVYAQEQDPPTFDHLKCFQIKDELSHRTVDTADLTPDQGALFGKQNCKIKLPANHFCVDTSKTNVKKPDGSPFETVAIDSQPAREYLCYELRCPRESITFDATDQFGNRSVRSKRGDYFCAPAETVVE